MSNTTSHGLTGILTLAVVWITFVGCTPRSLMVTEFTRMVHTGLPAIEQEQDLYLLAQSMPSHIKLMETLLANDPNNEDVLIMLARLYGGYAFAVLETELEARRLDQHAGLGISMPTESLEDAVARYLNRGAEYALQALETRHPLARQHLIEAQKARDFIQSLGPPEVPALFWYGFNLGGYIQHRLDSVSAMASAHLVESAMHRVVALNEAYYNGGSHLVLLVFYASRSPMTGGNPTKAALHLERHRQLVPGAMGLRQLYWARYALVQQQKRESFVEQLTQVASGQPADQDAGVLAAVASVRARIYLNAIDHFFD